MSMSESFCSSERSRKARGPPNATPHTDMAGLCNRLPEVRPACMLRQEDAKLNGSSEFVLLSLREKIERQQENPAGWQDKMYRDIQMHDIPAVTAPAAS